MRCPCVKALLLSTLTMGLTIEASASDSPWSLGVGVLNLSSPYIGVDNKNYGLPLVNYNGERLRASIFNLEYDIYEIERLKLSFATELGEDFLKVSDSKDSAIRMLEDRKISIYSGAKLSYHSPIGIFNTSALYDISGHSEGSIFKINYSYPIRLTNDLTFIPSVGTTFKSADVANYYYGTDNYNVGNTTDLSLNMIISYKISESLNATAFLRHIVLDKDISNSPIVENDSVTMAMLSLTYKF
ncbi:MltA-interacting protein precursor [Shewanella putrefaciens]|uniref:MipA/OmpV family protein n=1 Tax=Shewanella putrefaciens TaxID=24 RepID=UPI000DFCDF19|nr:MipA/OmpV family protein [Shewanella putrefaciens]SUI57598.1 MltA-interacting protein precursor [Shewanella putrefaciens]